MLRRNVLIFHSGALGDFILTWPLALALGRLWPQSRIIYVTQKQKGLLAEKALRVEWTDAESGWHHLHANPADLPEKSRAQLDSAHAIFAFTPNPADPSIKAIQELAGSAQIIPVSVKPPEDFHQHASQYLLETLSPVPAVQSATQSFITSIAARGISISRPGSSGAGPTLIHPGSGSPSKCWPLENFLHLADKLNHENRRCHFVIGEVERHRWPDADLHRLESAAPVIHPATYRDLLDAISSADLFIGNDSGPAHLAAIVATPTIVLFGPTNPAIWSPLGPRVTIIRRQPLQDLSVAEVESATRHPAPV
ncbi:MAG: glycosyltransferase family 9 protein [Tepidisphaeraceae bacterium]|jgi:hypothetical protein